MGLATNLAGWDILEVHEKVAYLLVQIQEKSVTVASARFVGGWGNPPSASQPPKFSWIPTGLVKNSKKIHCWPSPILPQIEY